METAMIQRYIRDHTKHILVIALSFLWAMTSFFHLFNSGFFSNTVAFAGVAGSNALGRNSILNVGPGTNALIDALKDYSFIPEIVANSNRAFFSVEGKMVTLANSNIKVYEYANNDTLINDVEEFKKSSKTTYGSWKKNVHLYNNEKVIVFYLGEIKEIQDALKNIIGNEVVM